MNTLEKIEEILGRYTNSPVAFDDGVERVTFQERYFPISDLVKELSTLLTPKTTSTDIEEVKDKYYSEGYKKGYDEGLENGKSLAPHLSNKSELKKEAVREFVDILLDGRGRKTEVWHYELNDANYMEASAFGEYIKIRELEKALETYLSQLNKEEE